MSSKTQMYRWVDFWVFFFCIFFINVRQALSRNIPEKLIALKNSKKLY